MAVTNGCVSVSEHPANDRQVECECQKRQNTGVTRGVGWADRPNGLRPTARAGIAQSVVC